MSAAATMAGPCHSGSHWSSPRLPHSGPKRRHASRTTGRVVSQPPVNADTKTLTTAGVHVDRSFEWENLFSGSLTGAARPRWRKMIGRVGASILKLIWGPLEGCGGLWRCRAALPLGSCWENEREPSSRWAAPRFANSRMVISWGLPDVRAIRAGGNFPRSNPKCSKSCASASRRRKR